MQSKITVEETDALWRDQQGAWHFKKPHVTKEISPEVYQRLIQSPASNLTDCIQQTPQDDPGIPVAHPSSLNIPCNGASRSFQLFKMGIASSQEEIMFALTAENFGFEIAADLAARFHWKVQRPLRALRAALKQHEQNR